MLILNVFYEYIKNLVFFLLFSSFMQVIMPSNKFKSYINLIFGMIFIFIMLKPIEDVYYMLDNKVVDAGDVEGLEVSNMMFGNQNEMILEQALELEEIENKIMLDIFRDNIKSQVQDMLNKDRELKNRYVVQDVEISLYNNLSYGVEIREIIVILRDMIEIYNKQDTGDIIESFVAIDRVEGFKEIEIGEIGEIEIGVQMEDVEVVYGLDEEENSEEVIKIKDIISNEYNLLIENINIIII